MILKLMVVGYVSGAALQLFGWTFVGYGGPRFSGDRLPKSTIFMADSRDFLAIKLMTQTYFL